ncbi:HNH endonuclease [Laspinema palackyanum]|uniref:HNH endonuclease n=1 Tax=Laspinema palackyanum TaxID=3231601 RepID=UPI00345CBD33|nr:HNH endonuclease [Laspinema sp. D2c]
MLDYYAKKFATLRVDRKRGPAPHKPILLLSVIELIERGHIRKNQIVLDAELVAAFLKLWGQLATTDHRSDIGLPFFHLQGDGFWHYQPKPGYEALVQSKAKIRSVGAIRELVECAFLDDELFHLLRHPVTRAHLAQVLINKWFPEKISQIENLLQLDAFEEMTRRFRESGGEIYQPEDLEDEQKTIVRDGAFRKVVVQVYQHRCAFCGLQILNSLGQNIVDGAHIKPFSRFYDDRLDNGLSLCKNHHWAFDRGWFSLEDDYRIVVADDLREESPHSRPMREFEGERIWLPAQTKYRPRPEAIAWHRTHIFQQAS